MADALSQDILRLAKSVSDDGDFDVISYAGPIYRPYDEAFIEQCPQATRHKNVLLMVTTHGGDAHAAYRIARSLRRCYGKGEVVILVDTDCESAGTLLALVADRLILGDLAELGPIDVQLRKPDEAGEVSSGLTPMQALDTLKNEALTYFTDFFEKFRYDPKIGVTTRTAIESAINFTVGLMGPVYTQLDPIRMGELDRKVKIALEYGNRIQSSNVKPKALVKLIAAYPSHDFVIDAHEASELFEKVEKPTDNQRALCAALRERARGYLRQRTPEVLFISEQIEAQTKVKELEDGHRSNARRKKYAPPSKRRRSNGAARVNAGG